MSYFSQPTLLMFLGLPGSGKSYFARAAADKMNAIRISSDAMRLSIFGSLEEIDRIHEVEGRTRLNDYTFRALDYVAEQILGRGYDVIYDTHHNKRTDRERLEQLAARYNALAVLLWVRTPDHVALERGQTRTAQIDQRQLSEDKMRAVMARHQAEMDEPQEGELAVAVSGEVPFDEQFQEFQLQVEKING